MEESSFQSPISQFNYSSSQTPKKSKKLLYIIIFVVLILIFFFAIQKFFFASNDQVETTEITPTPTEYQFPTDTPTPSQASPTEEPTSAAKATATPTTKAINPVDSATKLDRSMLSVEVQNGSGEAGAAGKGADVLRGFGYKVSGTGNADNYDYENVTIQVKSTKSNYLALLKKDLGFSYTVGSTSADLDSSSTADALVIIGK